MKTLHSEIEELTAKLKLLRIERSGLLECNTAFPESANTADIANRLFKYLARGLESGWSYPHSRSYADDLGYYYYESLIHHKDENQATMLCELSDVKSIMSKSLSRDMWIEYVKDIFKDPVSLKQFRSMMLRKSPTKFVEALQDFDVPIMLVKEQKITKKTWVLCLPQQIYSYQKHILNDNC